MNDLSLTWDLEAAAADCSIAENDLATSEGLESAVFLSLFTDAPAEDFKGWWGDNTADIEGDVIGSKLWTLARGKQTPQTLADAKQFSEEALAWMLADKVTDKIEVVSEFIAAGIMGIGVTIHRPDADPVSFRYNYTWAAQEVRLA